MRKLLWTFFVSCCFSLPAAAGSRIAFLELRDAQGRVVQYEPGGRFVHTAIQFKEIGSKWLNAYPGEGVAIISWERLQQHGQIVEILEIPDDVNWQQVQKYLGLPFDFYYSWDDKAFYCTELIGKLLNVPTHPMTFNKKVWPSNYWKFNGLPGLSPDALYSWARARH